MKDFKFTAAFGESNSEVRLLNLFGSTGQNGGIHIYIDNYYNGCLFKRNNVWVAFFNQPDHFTFEDVCILGEIIENEIL